MLLIQSFYHNIRPNIAERLNMEFDFKLLLKRIVINDPRKLPSLSNLISCLLYVVCGVLTRSLIVFCSGLQFSDNILGKALVNTICTFSSSGGVSSDSVLICYFNCLCCTIISFLKFHRGSRWHDLATPLHDENCFGLYVQSSSFYFM